MHSSAVLGDIGDTESGLHCDAPYICHRFHRQLLWNKLPSLKDTLVRNSDRPSHATDRLTGVKWRSTNEFCPVTIFFRYAPLGRGEIEQKFFSAKQIWQIKGFHCTQSDAQVKPLVVFPWQPLCFAQGEAQTTLSSPLLVSAANVRPAFDAITSTQYNAVHCTQMQLNFQCCSNMRHTYY